MLNLESILRISANITSIHKLCYSPSCDIKQTNIVSRNFRHFLGQNTNSTRTLLIFHILKLKLVPISLVFYPLICPFSLLEFFFLYIPSPRVNTEKIKCRLLSVFRISTVYTKALATVV